MGTSRRLIAPLRSQPRRHPTGRPAAAGRPRLRGASAPDRQGARVAEGEAEHLRRAIEGLYRCTARLVQSVPLKERHDDEVWEGVVHVFDLVGLDAAPRAYAWSSPAEGGDRRRHFAVLHEGSITSPADAVRALLIAAQQRKR